MCVAGERTGNALPAAVRPMASSDVAEALSILKESPEASLWSSESLLESVSRGAAWAADSEAGVAGILIGRIAGDEFEILNLAVKNTHRRKGFATRLVRTALESAHSQGVRRCFLEVRASNRAGIALYEHVGFRACGLRANYYRNPQEDAVVMVWYEERRNS